MLVWLVLCGGEGVAGNEEYPRELLMIELRRSAAVRAATAVTGSRANRIIEAMCFYTGFSARIVSQQELLKLNQEALKLATFVFS